MAHLHTCTCGRVHRCDEPDHTKASWYQCQRWCPDFGHHGYDEVSYFAHITRSEDANFFRTADKIVALCPKLHQDQ